MLCECKWGSQLFASYGRKPSAYGCAGLAARGAAGVAFAALVVGAPLAAADGTPGVAPGIAGCAAPPCTRGFGAETPATSEPRPKRCKLGASSFPVGSRLFADWNFCIAATVLPSHFPFGVP